MQSIFDTFTLILPTLVEQFTTYLDSLRKSKRGRSRTLDLTVFFKAFYSNVRDSTTPSNFNYYFGLPKSTYFHYLKLLKQSYIFTTLEQIALTNYSFDSTLLVKVVNLDEFTTSALSYNKEEYCGNLIVEKNGKRRKVHSILTYKGDNDGQDA